MKNLIGINAVNSIDFAKQVFHYFNKRQPIVIIKEDTPKGLFEYKKIITPDNTTGWLEVKQATLPDDTLAQITFTSGTEGKPKVILLNHNTLENTVYRLNKVMNIDHSIREYVGVPVYHSFGFARCRAICAVGGKAFIPKNGFNPIEIAKMLKEDSINAISAVPTLWRMILENKRIIEPLGDKVKWIEIGSQFMSTEEKKQMLHLFPNATIVQHYGLTEASRSTFLTLNEIETQHLNSVGQCQSEPTIKISADNRIMIKGSHVADGTFENNEFKSLTDKNNWLLTNDLGHIKNGYLYYDGRSDDIINCAGIKVDPENIQNQLEHNLNLPNKVAISKYPCPTRGEGFLLAVLKSCPLEDNALVSELNNVLKNQSISAASSIKLIRLNSFPVTSTGKIQRKSLTQQYQPNSKSINQPTSSKKQTHYLYQDYSTIFPEQKINPHDTFSSLGGDSLNYVHISMTLEEHLGFLPHDWENKKIGTLAKLKPKEKEFFSAVESSIVLRVIAIFAVVLTHSGFDYTGGGTYLLFLLIGYNMARFKHNEFTQSGLWNWFNTYAIKILIPYTFLTLIFMLYVKEFDITTVFLVTNLIKLKLTTVFPFWFVQVLLQSLLLLSIIFSFSLVRQKIKTHPWEVSVFILSLLVLIRFTFPLIWETDYLKNLVPQRFIMLIWLGYCFNFANNITRKLFIFMAGSVITCFDVNFKFTLYWLIMGGFILAFFPYLKIPSFSKKLINLVANATFYIFIFNGVILLFLYKVTPIDSKLIIATATMIISVILWKISTLMGVEKKMVNFFYHVIKK